MNRNAPQYVSKQSADYTTGDCTPKRMENTPIRIQTIDRLLFGETHPHTYPNSLQTTQPGIVPQSEPLFGETRPPKKKQSADAQPGIVPPSELLSRETHPHSYSQQPTQRYAPAYFPFARPKANTRLPNGGTNAFGKGSTMWWRSTKCKTPMQRTTSEPF